MDAKKLSEREVYGDLVRSQDYEELRAALRGSEDANLKLKLQYGSADMYWDGDESSESPEEHAEECKLGIGDEFELQAAVYWPTKWRVTKIRKPAGDDEIEDSEYECEEIGCRAEELKFQAYFEMKAKLRESEEREKSADKCVEALFAEHKITYGTDSEQGLCYKIEYLALSIHEDALEREKKLVEALREKRVEHLWIPVSERLPIARATVYVAVVSKPDKSVFVTEGYVSEGEWYFLSVYGETAFAEYGWVPEYWMAKYIEPQPPAALLALYPVEPPTAEKEE